MKVKNIQLLNFRNYKDFSISFYDHVNILIGANARGKTNLMESIYFLSIAKSFRTLKQNDLIKIGEKVAHVKGTIESTKRIKDIQCSISENEKKLTIDGFVIKKYGEFIGNFNVVLFTPDDLSLVKAAPMNRRKFLDIELSKISPIYMYSLNKYNILLKEKNIYLKTVDKNKIDSIYLDVLDDQLIEVSKDIILYRKDFINKLNKKIKDIYLLFHLDNEYIQLEYDCFIKDKQIKDVYKECRKSDIKYCQSSKGIHKEDVKILINNLPASIYASQGQQRTIVLAIKIALIDIIKEEIGEYPVLLLDDVLSELDNSRKEMLLSILNKEIQTFITTTSIEGINHDIVEKAKKIYIK
ncbi:DNA replication/repair protein RecF [Tannockella kyphosi]|uniref:DNA replication/repair protein RecF n=1 Tax=Tannockella kyphosi TaxID=2899121 RepID=UPI0020112911|nr:DNA replication/repair protein RecF [Tannockella kyphosi]